MKPKEILTREFITNEVNNGRRSKDISKKTGVNDRTIRWYFRKYKLNVPKWKPHKAWNKGLLGWNKGHIVLEETRKKIGKANKGRKHTKEFKNKLHNWYKKNGLTEKQKIALDRTGCKPWNFKGNKDWENKKIRKNQKYQKWQQDIYRRDKWICKSCGIKCERKNIIAHHLKSFSKILEENKIKTLERALNCEELWNIDNGIVLCRGCHLLIHKNGNLVKVAIN